jgi:hypothetical protein
MKINHIINYTIVLFLFCLLNEVSFCQTIKTLSYNVDQLKGDVILYEILAFNLIFPDSTTNSYVPDEIVISCNEQFKVELTNCSINQNWRCGIEDSAMKLVRCDTVLSDSTMNLSYSFMASEACKGCMVFIGSNNPLDQHSLAVEYTCSPITPVEFNLTHQEWLFDTTSGLSKSKVNLSGTTNAQKIKVETYGDGVLGAASIYPKNDGSFSATVGIEFRYDPDHTWVPTRGTRISIYGAIGFPKILILPYSRTVSVNETNGIQALKIFDLCQNYPNPFNPSTIISFNLPLKSFVTLKIFDIVGREVATLINEELSAGNHSHQWNATNASSGIYFYRLQAGSFTLTKKLVLLR